jgi:hypothetical protein
MTKTGDRSRDRQRALQLEPQRQQVQVGAQLLEIPRDLWQRRWHSSRQLERLRQLCQPLESGLSPWLRCEKYLVDIR